jgi:NADPH2:quinone reductase
MLGREASGTIQATGSGDTNSLSVGDRVVYMSTSTYAEYTASPSLHASKIPDDVSNEVATAAFLQGLTALTLIRAAHPVQKGDWVLVHAAAGGTGQLLVQMLKKIGAKVIGTCSTSKIELVKGYDLDVVIDYSVEDFVAKVKEVTDGKGVAAVFDGVGKSTFDGSLESVARLGSMISFGNASGAVPPFTIR